MSRLRSLIGLLVMSLLVSTGAMAAKSTYKPKFKYDAKKELALYNKEVKYLPVSIENNSIFADQKAFEKAFEAAQKNSRHVAMAKTDVTSSAVEAELSAKFKEMRKALIGDAKTPGIKSKEDLNSLVEHYSKPEVFNAITDPDAKFFAFQLRALRPAKSVIFRAREYIAKNSATRTLIVSALRAQISGIEHFYPTTGSDKTNYGEIVFRYVTEPLPDMEPAITNDAQLFLFLQGLRAYSEKESELFKTFVYTMPEFWWDVKLYAPYAKFINEKDQYVKIGYAELLAVYAGTRLNVSSLYSMTAYSLVGLQAAVEESQAYFGVGVSALFNSLGVEGMSSKNKFDVIAKKTNFLFSQTDKTQACMQNALKYLREAAQAGMVAYEDVRGRSADDIRLFESRFVTPALRGSDNSVRGLANLLDFPIPNEKSYGKDSTAKETQLLDADKANGTIHSMIVAGDVIKVDLVGFMTNPPANLSDLYPIAWKTDEFSYNEPSVISVKSWKDKEDDLRNYKYEMAAEWNLKAWKTLFPDLKAMDGKPENTTELGRHIRILSQAWGSSAFAVPLTFFVY